MEYLSPSELVTYVQKIAAQPKLWRHLVEHGDKRGYHELADTPVFNCWVITWNTGHDTGLHDHDGSAGGVVVVEGAVLESRLNQISVKVQDQPSIKVIGETERPYLKDDTLSFGPWDIHRVRHTGIKPAVTIHAYSPPLIRMGSYGFVNHEFKRMPMGKEELRPLEIAIKDGNNS